MGIKKRRTRSRRKLILIAAEGNNVTEQNYFRQFNVRQTGYQVVFARGNYTDPLQMTKALERKMKESEFNIARGDRAFCVVDVDAKSEAALEVEKLSNLYKPKGIEYIVSNPCFEMWYLLHFAYTTKPFQDSSKMIRELKKHIRDYEKNKDVFEILYPITGSAIENSKRLS